MIKIAKHIDVITGPMYSGKSGYLIQRIDRLQRAKKTIDIVKPTFDSRFSLNDIASRNGAKSPCKTVNSVFQLINFINTSEAEYIAIDELNLLNKTTIVHNLLIETILKSDKKFIISTLNKFYDGTVVPITKEILGISDHITTLSSVCPECGDDAYYSDRIIESKEYTLVGDSESYRPLCKNCLDDKLNTENSWKR